MTMLLRVIFALPILLIVCGQQDRCRQERKIGRCLAYFPRFYYNASSGQCEAFVYGGCEGNENNFENLEECQKSCENQTPRSEIDNTPEGPGEGAAKVEGVCKEKAEKGPCRALITRWYYNDNIGECRTFTYGGCRGNGNNFNSKEDCEKQCKVREIDSGKVTSQVDERAQVCSLPGLAGRCRGHFRRWMFNPKSQLCEEMVYGGCGGNRNNFRQKEDCEKFCMVVGKVADGVENGVKEQETDVCAMPRSSGPCRGKLIRWAFDAKSQTCEKFHYGGCGGNKNNHLTREACEVSCDPCSQPLERGSCSGQTARWYYNTAIKTCVPFLYSGCGGNRNNFADAVECSQRCGTHSRRFVT